MSRIDEALKRVAAAGKLASDGPAPVAVEPRFDGSLERYVAEKPALRPAAPHPQPKLRTAAPVVSPASGDDRSRIAMFQVGLDGKLVVSRQISPVSIEQYRRLAATLHDLQQQRQVRSLMVSSAVPREGKTLTIANLALTLSESYLQRVLLIDADLRRPSIHDLFGIPIGAGLADALRSGGPLPVVDISTRLSVLTAGRQEKTSPLAQLTSARLPVIIEEASRVFDWVLVDTPPIGLLPDAQHVARVCDGVLFVISAGSTSYKVVQRSLAELGSDRVVGTLLNRMRPDAVTMHGYGEYYSSDSHESDE